MLRTSITEFDTVKVASEVSGKAPVQFRFSGRSLNPSQIEAYITQSGELIDVVVYGNSVDRNLPSKVVYFPDTISLSPRWVWDFVREAAALATAAA